MKRVWSQAVSSCRALVKAVRAQSCHFTGDEQLALLAVLFLFLLGLAVWTVRMVLR